MIALLVIYFLYVLGFIIFSIMGLYHLWKYGFRGDMTKITMITYVIVSGLIIIFSLIAILSLNWGGINLPSLDKLIPTFFRG